MAESLFSKMRTLVMAHAHEAADAAIDMDSIPVLTQKVREFEQNIDTTKHLAAVAAANVTTLQSQHDAKQAQINESTARAKAWKSKGDPTSLGYAKNEVEQILFHQNELAAIQSQLDAAQANSIALDGAKDKLVAKHQEIYSRLQLLKSKDAAAAALGQATKNLQQIQSFATDALNGESVDNISDRIDAKSNVAKEEFNRTIADMSTPPDPLKDEKADALLASL
jgi:phage shock protein A